MLAVTSFSIALVASGQSDCAHPMSTRTANTAESTPTSVLDIAAARFPASHARNYIVRTGDTLSGIAARFGVRGGWPALYAANRQAIGPDPAIIHAGTVLRIPRAAPSPRGRRHPAYRRHRPEPRPQLPAESGRHGSPAAKAAPPSAGMPGWLKSTLLGLGLLIVAAFIAEPVVNARHRRRRRASLSPQSRQVGGRTQDPGRPRVADARILLTDHDRLVVTRDMRDGTVCVLRPAGADPGEILRAARLVLPEEDYQALAEHLGVPAAESADLAGTEDRGGPAPLAVRRLLRCPFPQRFDERGDMAPVLGGQLIDAGDQQFSISVAVRVGCALTLPLGQWLVVVVQARGLSGGGPDGRDRHIQAFGKPVERGWARWPDEVARHRQGVDGGTGQSTPPGDLAIGPASLAHPLVN